MSGMKIAITILDNRIAPVFDVSRRVLVLEVGRDGITNRTEAILPLSSPVDKVSYLLNLGVEELICGAISRPVYSHMQNIGLRTYPFIAGDIEQIITAWEAKQLDDIHFLMPGCGCRGRCKRNRAGRENL